jgi:hypothetical protein
MVRSDVSFPVNSYRFASSETVGVLHANFSEESLEKCDGSGLGGISGVGKDSKGFKGFFLYGTQ